MEELCVHQLTFLGGELLPVSGRQVLMSSDAHVLHRPVDSTYRGWLLVSSV